MANAERLSDDLFQFGVNRILSHGAPRWRMMPNGCLGSPVLVLPHGCRDRSAKALGRDRFDDAGHQGDVDSSRLSFITRVSEMAGLQSGNHHCFENSQVETLTCGVSF